MRHRSINVSTLVTISRRNRSVERDESLAYEIIVVDDPTGRSRDNRAREFSRMFTLKVQSPLGNQLLQLMITHPLPVRERKNILGPLICFVKVSTDDS